MLKYFIKLTVLISVISCGTDFSRHTEKIPQQDISMKISIIQDTMYIKKWLIKVITDYVNSDDLKVTNENLRSALTDDYYNYKLEAITLEYSEMTEKEFQEKWKAKYDTKYVGSGGFFTSIMDNGDVEISDCKQLESLGDTAQIFHTVVHDLRWKTDYKLDIKVILKDNKLLIDDIKEYK